MGETTILQMDFISADENKPVSIKLADPREDLTAETVQAAMELVNDMRVFVKINGSNFEPAKIKGAKVINTVVNDFDITVE